MAVDKTQTYPLEEKPQDSERNLLAELSLKVDRTVFKVDSLEDKSDDKEYWLARTPQERLRQVELLRRINYGHKAAARLQRVLEVAQRE